MPPVIRRPLALTLSSCTASVSDHLRTHVTRKFHAYRSMRGLVGSFGVLMRALVQVGVGPIQGGLGLVLGIGAAHGAGVEAAARMCEKT
jgi:hypothetical protein